MSAGTEAIVNMIKDTKIDDFKIKGFDGEITINDTTLNDLFKINGDKVNIVIDKVNEFFRTAEDELQVSVIYKNSQGNFVKLKKMNFGDVKVMAQPNKEITEDGIKYKLESGPNKLDKIDNLDKPIVFKQKQSSSTPSGAQAGNNSGQGANSLEPIQKEAGKTILKAYKASKAAKALTGNNSVTAQQQGTQGAIGTAQGGPGGDANSVTAQQQGTQGAIGTAQGGPGGDANSGAPVTGTLAQNLGTQGTQGGLPPGGGGKRTKRRRSKRVATKKK